MTGTGVPWPPGAATGVGSLPGTEVREATRTVFGELPDLPHLPELPARGPGADMIGRTVAQLVGLHIDLQPSGWRLVDRPSGDERRARAMLAEDLDALEEYAAGYAGSLKVQLAGPWTVAAALELPRGGKVLGDPGACRDVAASLAETAAAHVGDVRRRVPDATVVLQMDEPSLPAVLAGRLRSASGWQGLPAVEEPVAEAALRHVVELAGALVIAHCCAADVPVGLFQRSGAVAVSLDADALGEAGVDALGEAADSGLGMVLGVVPATEAELSDLAVTVATVRVLGSRMGLSGERLIQTVALAPTCGLAGATPAYARAAMARCRAAGVRLREDPEG